MSVSIELPGRGMVNISAHRVDEAVNLYDERLFFGRNVRNGDWCIFMKMPHGEPPVPILGFGDTIPHPDDALRRLYNSDTIRHGEEILDRMNRENAALEKKHDAPADNATGILAEAIESLNVHTGQTRHWRSLSKATESRRANGA